MPNPLHIAEDALALFIAHKGEAFLRWGLPILLLFSMKMFTHLCDWVIKVSVITPDLHTDFEVNLASLISELKEQQYSELRINFIVMKERLKYAKGAVYESLVQFLCNHLLR
jgi:hypothetical protein